MTRSLCSRKTLLVISITCLLATPLLAENKKAAQEAGANLFREKGCTYCHGPALQGTPKGPSLTNVRKTRKPGQIAAQIQNGGQKMPPFGDSLSQREIMQLVSFLRAKQAEVKSATGQDHSSNISLSNPAQ